MADEQNTIDVEATALRTQRNVADLHERINRLEHSVGQKAEDLKSVSAQNRSLLKHIKVLDKQLERLADTPPPTPKPSYLEELAEVEFGPRYCPDGGKPCDMGTSDAQRRCTRCSIVYALRKLLERAVEVAESANPMFASAQAQSIHHTEDSLRRAARLQSDHRGQMVWSVIAEAIRKLGEPR